MIRLYLKTAWRNLKRYRRYSIINISGLAIGVAAFWLIMLCVIDERSYDRFHENGDRIYRIAQHGRWGDGKFDLALTSVPYAAALKKDYPQVEEVVKIDREGGGIIESGMKSFLARDIVYSDNSIFKIFSFPFVSGNSQSALSEPNSVVLTRTLAEKLFTSVESALDKTIMISGVPNKVTGLIQDVPKNSHLSFSALRSFDKNFSDGWANAHVYTYVLLKKNTDPATIEGQSEEFYQRYLKNDFENVQYRMELQPLTDIHLHSQLDYEISRNGSSVAVNTFSIVAILILVLAVINYVNLTTARSNARLKEIGIRKVMGSGTAHIANLFIVESILLALLATAAGLMLTKLGLPYFNQLAGKTMDLWPFGITASIVLFVVFSVLTGAVSGIYPALFLSRRQMIPAMKGQGANPFATGIFRKSLVTFQFVITIVMITGSLIIYRQLQFVSQKYLGFEKAGLLTFHIDDVKVREKLPHIKAALLQNASITSAAGAGNPIGNNDLGLRDFNVDANGRSLPETKMVQDISVDEDFVTTMKLQLIAGRNFMAGKTDSAIGAILVNETLVQQLGWKNPIGRQVKCSNNSGGASSSTIVGVVRDFNTYSLQHRITPVVLRLATSAREKDNLYLRINPARATEAIEHMQTVYGSYADRAKADFHFLDQNFARQYETEQKQGSLLLTFTLLAIAIACLGLFGLVTFTAEQRVKEIGIRKVIGAGIVDIVRLLNGELMRLVLLAALISTPIAWWAMQLWLDRFAYRISMPWWAFVLAGALALLIAFITITMRSINAALTNPVKNLRSE